jgi:acetylornithine deacetylase
VTIAASAAEILRELVAIPSPSTVSNLPVLQWVATYLEPLGWRIDWLNWTDEAGIEKANLIARPGNAASDAQIDTLTDAPIDLAFVCHTDTVPYAANWSDALKLRELDGNLHGCGVCDVKGPLACFLAAAATVKSSSQRVALILTADEEVGCKGMERLLASPQFAGLRITSAIISEPTSLRPGIAGKGYGLARVTVEGREAHSAFPQQGVSAISIAARLITHIEDHSWTPRTGSLSTEDASLKSLFDPPHTTVNIGVISGGTAKNILAGECSFLVEWRALPGESQGAFQATLEAIADEAQRAAHGAKIHVEGLRDEPGFAPAARGPLQSQLAGLLPGTPVGISSPVGISFGSEATRIARIADEVIVMGPGDMRTAHSERECVPVAELEMWTRVLAELIAG